MAFKFDMFANVKDVIRGAGEVGQSFEDMADSLDPLTKAADRAGDKIGDSIGDGAKDAARQVEGLGKDGKTGLRKIEDGSEEAKSEVAKLERSFREAADAAKKEMSTAGDSVKREVKRGTDGAQEGLKDFKDESTSTAKESAASFDGSAESIIDAFQEVAANAFIGFGPAGLVAGLAAAAGIGLISTAINQGTEDGEALKQKVADLTAELITAGDKGAPSLEYLVSQLQELATATEGTNLKELSKIAQGAGADFKDLAQAFAGNADGARDVWRETEKTIDRLKEESASLDQNTQAGKERAAAYSEQIDYLERYQDKIGEAIGTVEQATEAEQNYADAGGHAMETRAAAVETYQAALDDSLGSFDEFTNAETGALDPAGYIAGIQARIDATGSFNSNVQSIATQFNLTDAEVQAILNQGLEFGPMLQSIIDSGLTGEFVGQVQGAVGGGQEILDGNPLNTTAQVDADTDKATDATDAFTNTKRETTIQAKADTRQAESDIRSVSNAAYSAVIAVRAALSEAQGDVDRFINNNDGRSFTMVQKVVDRNGTPVA